MFDPGKFLIFLRTQLFILKDIYYIVPRIFKLLIAKDFFKKRSILPRARHHDPLMVVC